MDNIWDYSNEELDLNLFQMVFPCEEQAPAMSPSEGLIQTPLLSDYDAYYASLSACSSVPTSESPSSLECYTPQLSYSPIITTTRSHSLKRDKRSISSYSRWTAEEDELLRQAVQLYGSHKWSLIATHIPNRTPMQCSTRWLGALNPNIHKGRWTESEDDILRYFVLDYAHVTDADGRIQPIPWNKIAERIPNRTGIQCQARWTEALDPSVRKGKWSKEEDEFLKKGVKEFGQCWIRIAETIHGRTQRQCRTRWMQIKFKQDRQKRSTKKTKNIRVTTNNKNNTEMSLLDSNTMIHYPNNNAKLDPMSFFKQEYAFPPTYWHEIQQNSFL